VTVLFGLGCLPDVEERIPDVSEEGDDLGDLALDVAFDEGPEAETPPVDTVPEGIDSADLTLDESAEADGDETGVDLPAEEVPAPVCPNGVCEPGENDTTCHDDCHCGNGVCDVDKNENTKNCPDDCCDHRDCICDTMDCGETVETNPHDCSACGDHVMSPGENPACCPLDACWSGGGSGCGDGVCMGELCDESSETCPQDCTGACGNGTCDKGENPQSCSEDCLHKVCGNGECEPPDEDPVKCAMDCTPVPSCGDCICSGGETFWNCPVDCGYCGDGICSQCLKESLENCPKDCA
jgi:hypothetical protein